MIYINIDALNIPADLLAEAEQLKRELQEITDEKQRIDFIDKNCHIWQMIKAEMERISHNKCWYCEAVNIRGDLHVDHYRPKAKIKNKDKNAKPGYSWLAFNYKNFRLSCSYCNTGHRGTDKIVRGKRCQFPLFDESKRATSDKCNIDDELPFLLDPTNPVDPTLLWFNDEGKAKPKIENPESFLFQRVIVSIEILNLNEIKIKEARQEIWNTCNKLIYEAELASRDYLNGSLAGKLKFEQKMQEMRKMADSSSPFSATAYACFQGCAIDWVRTSFR